MSRNSIADTFRDPPNEYRPVPQWSLNGDLTEERITEQLEQFKEQGCGGLFSHPRPGHITGYLTDRWFELWEFAAAECERLGMDFHIYDEFMCPGGTAGGNVTAENPTLIQKELVLRKAGCAGPACPGEVLVRVRIAPDSGEATEASESEATHELVLTSRPSGQGGLPPPDLCRRETADTFIRTTHDRYAQYSGHRFGKNVRLMFCDEPMILATQAGFPFSRFLVYEFRKDHGYDLTENLIPLCFTAEGSAPVRFDFWWTANRLFNMNFMKPLHDWCEANDLLCTGHLMEHEWPSPSHNPDSMAGLRWMQAPGDDLLGFQFEPTRLEKNAMWLMNLKELSSIVNQLGRKWSMVETTGARGYHTAFEMFKPCEDFTLSFGVNVIDPHLSHETLAGRSKYDWPQTLSDHSPWWKYYGNHADHVARVNAALSQGREFNRVLLLHPTTTGWLHFTGKGFDAVCGGEGGSALQEMQESQTKLAAALYAAQVDFDMGDEFIMEEFGKVEDGKLTVGERTYEAVIIPPTMETINRSTLKLLATYAAQGGVIYALRNAPTMVQGRKSPEPAELEKASSWNRVESADELVGEIRAKFPPYCSTPSGEALPSGIVWRRAVADEGAVWFFCNPWAERIETDVLLDGLSVKRLDSATGSVETAPFERTGEKVAVHLALEPRGHDLLLVSDEAIEPAASLEKPAATPVELEPKAVERLRPNLLFIDYCDVEAYGMKEEDRNTAVADGINWRWQGFDGNPWGKQFRRTIVDKAADPDSECTVTYRFTVGSGVSRGTLDSLSVCIERPWLYRITLNGTEIDQDSGERWFDEHMKRFPLGRAVREGENVLSLEARPFRTLVEIMPVYLAGAFSVEAGGKGFVLAEPSPLSMGDWTKQGAPFYPDAVRYTFSFTLDAPAEHLRVRLGKWEGQASCVLLDGTERGVVLHPPYELDIEGVVDAGEHELAVDIVGNMKNMMGSHHVEGHPLVWSYLGSPTSQPPGAEYRFYPTGLFEAPELAVLDRRG